jgi:MurNAc alpha-1-phosphate uridylyltransferase
MILAAGLGLRLRPVTLGTPKPLVAVAGMTMLDRVLDHLDRVGTAHKVVNLHWLGEQIRAHLAGRTDIAYSCEPDLLDTGGGVAKARPLLGSAPFYVCNADIVWHDGAVPALARLAAEWDGARMDALLLLPPLDRAFGYDGAGDFHLGGDGRLTRRRSGERADYLFGGVQILHPRLFAESLPSGPFSLNLLYDRAAAADRLFGIAHDGDWFHIGTPTALALADKKLAAP